MTFLDNLSLGLAVAMAPTALMVCAIGVTLGTLVGVLPGLGSLAAISIILPITYYLEPTIALILLAGIYYGATYGGSTAAILLNLPGTSSSAVTALDGYPLAQKGKAGVALFVTTISSFIGGTLAIVVMMLFAPPLANLSMQFSSVEYFSILLLGLVACSTLTNASPTKGLSMMIIGLVVGVMGTDVNSGARRFTFGMFELADGITLVALAMGLFGVAEVINNIGAKKLVPRQGISMRSMLPNREEMRQTISPSIRGWAIGSFIGTLPGAGATIASFMSYAFERRIAKDPSRFGEGAIEGVTGPESSNNAASQAAFIPTLSLGVPGDAVMAVMLGAMMIHGIVPGPNFVMTHADIFWGLVMSFWIGNVFLLVLNIPLIGIWVRVLSIPYRILFPCILFFICIGVFSIRNSPFEIYLVVLFGIFGYLATALRFPVAPLLLGYILSQLIEEHFRRGLLLARGDLTVFLERPISAAFIVMTLLILAVSLLKWMRERRMVKNETFP